MTEESDGGNGRRLVAALRARATSGVGPRWCLRFEKQRVKWRKTSGLRGQPGGHLCNEAVRRETLSSQELDAFWREA